MTTSQEDDKEFRQVSPHMTNVAAEDQVAMVGVNEAILGKAAYVDKTGTAEKPDPMRDVYLEFPLAMMAIADVTAYGALKHAPRGWQTFTPEYGLNYHRSKVGRHMLKEELEGPVNHEDGDLLHPAQTVWNMLAYLEHFLRLREEKALDKRPVS